MMPESKGPVWDCLLNIWTNPDGHFYWEGDHLLFEVPSFSWAANHLQKKTYEKILEKTNFKQSQHQPTKFQKKHRNAIDIHIHTKWVPTSYKSYLYNSTYRSEKKRETHLFVAIFGAQKKLQL